MLGFSDTFLLFFFQIATGGLFALAATPFHELDRAFYKSTAGVLYVIGLFALWGKATLYWEAPPDAGGLLSALELLSHGVFMLAFSCYLISLWGERRVLRARSFSISLFTGLLGLILSSQKFHQAPVLSSEALLFPASFFLSSLLLGSVTVGMLLGHWYLIDTGQTLDPFVRIYKFFVFTLIAQCLFLLFSPPILYSIGFAKTLEGLRQVWEKHATLLLTRALVGQVAPLILSYM
ncbi:MAG: hypothetical protein ACREX3_19910, partial [Gammaproteobacteria bacterium]